MLIIKHVSDSMTHNLHYKVETRALKPMSCMSGRSPIQWSPLVWNIASSTTKTLRNYHLDRGITKMTTNLPKVSFWLWLVSFLIYTKISSENRCHFHAPRLHYFHVPVMTPSVIRSRVWQRRHMLCCKLRQRHSVGDRHKVCC